MLLGQYFNFIDGTINARKDPGFQGVMGLTEQVSMNLLLPTGVYSLWSRDIPDPVETGTPPGSNMYGTHPMLMGQDNSGKWFSVFANLAGAQDWYITNEKITTPKLERST
jgi:hypothetical protein